MVQHEYTKHVVLALPRPAEITAPQLERYRKLACIYEFVHRAVAWDVTDAFAQRFCVASPPAGGRRICRCARVRPAYGCRNPGLGRTAKQIPPLFLILF